MECVEPCGAGFIGGSVTPKIPLSYDGFDQGDALLGNVHTLKERLPTRSRYNHSSHWVQEHG